MNDTILRAVLVGAIITVAWISARLLGRWAANVKFPSRFDFSDIGMTTSRTTIVEFTAPYCFECKAVQPTLQAAALLYEAEFKLIDAKEDPQKAAKYGVRSTPTILLVDSSGSIRKAWTGSPEDDDLDRALAETRKRSWASLLQPQAG